MALIGGMDGTPADSLAPLERKTRSEAWPQFGSEDQQRFRNCRGHQPQAGPTMKRRNLPADEAASMMATTGVQRRLTRGAAAEAPIIPEILFRIAFDQCLDRIAQHLCSHL